MNRDARTWLIAVSVCIIGALSAACSSTSRSQSGETIEAGTSDAGVPDSATGDVGDAGSGQPDGDASSTIPTDLPRIVNLGGPIIASPKIVPVFFANDDAAIVAELTDFVSKVGPSPYWTSATSEYGVGPASALTPVALMAPDNPPAMESDSQIAAWLAAKLDANDPELPVADANTIYALFYPAGVTVTTDFFGQPMQGCTDFYGYHAATQLDASHQNQEAVYIVLPRCASGVDSLVGIDLLTFATSHELVEAATDPLTTITPQQPAYISWDADHPYWEDTVGAELADACFVLNSTQSVAISGGYSVSRIWSNEAEAAGLDPCVPAPAGEVYFNAIPMFVDSASFNGQTVKGLHVPVGHSGTVELDLFSSGPTAGSWTVSAISVGGGPGLQFTFDKTAGQSGDKIQLTVDVPAGQPGSSELFGVVSSQGNQTEYWWGIIGN
jgi:hypothetical protein